MEQSSPVPSLLLDAQARGRQALLVGPGWLNWLLLLVSPGTPAFTCLHPTSSESLHRSQHCPTLPSPASCPPGARVPPPAMPFPQSRWVQASLLWVKRVQLNPCTLNTALLASAVLGSPLSLGQCLAHNVPPSWWLPHPPPAAIPLQLSPA